MDKSKSPGDDYIFVFQLKSSEGWTDFIHANLIDGQVIVVKNHGGIGEIEIVGDDELSYVPFCDTGYEYDDYFSYFIFPNRFKSNEKRTMFSVFLSAKTDAILFY